MRRSRFLRAGALAAGALLLDPRRLADGLAATCSSVGPYGPLGAPDARGIRLSAGFTSRVTQPVSGRT